MPVLTKDHAEKCVAKIKPIGKQKAYLPSRAEIRRMCELIREGWDEETEISRRCLRNHAPDFERIFRANRERQGPS